jgi:hypothetical protein
VGGGGGAVSPLTGAMSFTLKAMPDIGSSIAITHGSRVAYTDRSGQGAAVRAPEYCFALEGEGAVPGSLTFTWLSGGVLRTATEDGAGNIVGDAEGRVDYPSSIVVLRPYFMADPGAAIQVAYTVDQVHTEILSAPQPDAGGFVQLALAQQPAAGMVAISWATEHTLVPNSGVPNSPIVAGSDITYGVLPDTPPPVQHVVAEPYMHLPPLLLPNTAVNWPRSS